MGYVGNPCLYVVETFAGATPKKATPKADEHLQEAKGGPLPAPGPCAPGPSAPAPSAPGPCAPGPCEEEGARAEKGLKAAAAGASGGGEDADGENRPPPPSAHPHPHPHPHAHPQAHLGSQDDPILVI